MILFLVSLMLAPMQETSGVSVAGRDSPEVRLPVLADAVAVHDAEFFEVTIDAAGKYFVAGAELDLRSVQEAMTAWRARIRKSDEPGGFCAHPLRIRCDQQAPTKTIQWLMQSGGDERLKIYKVQFPVAVEKETDPVRALCYSLPKDEPDPAVPVERAVEMVEVNLKRTKGAGGQAWAFAADQISIRVGPARMEGLEGLEQTLRKLHQQNPLARLVIYPYPGTVAADLLLVIDCCHRSGFRDPGVGGAPMEG